MSFDWAEYLSAAKEWAADQRESHRRAAISRAYYAAFNHAKKHIVQSGREDVPKHGEAHARIPESLRHMQHNGLAKDLEALKRLRTWADYEAFEKPRLAEDVTKAITYAERIIEKLK